MRNKEEPSDSCELSLDQLLGIKYNIFYEYFFHFQHFLKAHRNLQFLKFGYDKLKFYEMLETKLFYKVI